MSSLVSPIMPNMKKHPTFMPTLWAAFTASSTRCRFCFFFRTLSTICCTPDSGAIRIFLHPALRIKAKSCGSRASARTPFGVHHSMFKRFSMSRLQIFAKRSRLNAMLSSRKSIWCLP